MTLPVLLLGAAVAAFAADPPKPPAAPGSAAANKSAFAGRRDRLETVFWKVVDASKDPEFLVWYDGAPLEEEPRFEYSDEEREIGFSCQPWGITGGHTPALAVFCHGTPVVAFGSGIFQFGINEHQWAFTSGHELAHLLFRHGEK